MTYDVGEALVAMAKTIAVLEVRRSTGADEQLVTNAVDMMAESVLKGPITVPQVLSLIAATESALDFTPDTRRHPEEIADESWSRSSRVAASLGEAAPAVKEPSPADVGAVIAAWAALTPGVVGLAGQPAELFRARRSLQAVDTDPSKTVHALADLAIRVIRRRDSGDYD